jgi:uncharacterized protein YegJ (DUF2314 family)
MFLIVSLLLSTILQVAEATSKAEFDAAFRQSNRDNVSPADKRYVREFEDKIFDAVASQAMLSCLTKTPDTVEPAMLVFIISADGKIVRAIATPGIKYGECIVSQLHLPISVPRPPHDNFVFAAGVANHSHAETKDRAPKDRPTRLEGNAAIAYDKAIAPYVARARATWPRARKRFLAGLPEGWSLAVSYRLLQTGKPTRQQRFEDTFVEVKEIKGSMIQGTIVNKLGVITNYREGESIEFPESKIMNWVFIRPDGSEEEGNVLGKFLEHYKPE